MAVTGNHPLRTVLLYTLAVGASILFSLPFVWMVGTSFKMDRELSSTQLSFVPETPVPARQSPYLDPRFYPEPTHPAWSGLRPVLETALSTMPAAKGMDAGLLAPGVFARLLQILPDETWTAAVEALQNQAVARITPEMVAGVRRNLSRRLLLGKVRVRSLDLMEADLTADTPPAEWFTVSGGPARLTPFEAEWAEWSYDFSAEGKQTADLEARLDLPFETGRLHRIQLSLTPDDGWHRVAVTLEMGGVLYRTRYGQHTGGTQPLMMVLQQAGPDDQPDSTKIKLWIPYEEVDRGPQYDHGPRRILMRLSLQESSQWDAWWLKCQRNYRKTLDYVPFWRYAATSAFLVILNIVGNIFSCSLVAYAFARLQWPGRQFGFALMLATLMIPPQVTMIPYFLIIKHLGWYNTLNPLWVMSFFGNAFNIFLLRQFMKGIPRDLEDAARIDGCNFLHIYWHVMMPLIKPTLACIAVFTFLAVWNDFMGPLLFLADQRLYPLSLGLYALKVQQGEFGMMMAGSLLMTLPVIVIFFLAQRTFIQGIALTGTKG